MQFCKESQTHFVEFRKKLLTEQLKIFITKQVILINKRSLKANKVPLTTKKFKIKM